MSEPVGHLRRRRTTLITSKPAAPSGIVLTHTLKGDSGPQHAYPIQAANN